MGIIGFSISFEKERFPSPVAFLHDLKEKTGLEDINFINKKLEHSSLRGGSIYMTFDDENQIVRIRVGLGIKLNYLIFATIYNLLEYGGVLENPIELPDWCKIPYSQALEYNDFVA